VTENYNNGFVNPPGLDLSQLVDRGSAVLLAWSPDYSPIESLKKFNSRRGAKNTLWRVPVPISPKS
jgi:hypothetical protein